MYFTRTDASYYTRDGLNRLAMAIKATIKAKGLSERGLARLAGISNVTVNKYSRGNIFKPQQKILEALAPHILRVREIDHERVIVDPGQTYEGDASALNKLATNQYKELLANNEPNN